MAATEHLSFFPWRSNRPPARVLILRLHALGDVAITLPACAALRQELPDSEIHFLASAGAAPLVGATEIFDRVHAMGIPSTRRGRLLASLSQARRIRDERYDLILDLQRNWMSRIIRVGARPRSWGELDRFSPRPAHERVLEVFWRVGFESLIPRFAIPIHDRDHLAARLLLMEHGWDGKRTLVLLNPGGFWATRNWPVKNYLCLAELWLNHEDAQFVFMGTERIMEKSALLCSGLGNAGINLAGKTTPGEALGILKHTTLAVSEDSGLLHMAWATGVPTIALFGSSNHRWSAPPDAHVRSFHSGDLPCGSCMQPECRFGDVHCLTRLTPEEVFRAAMELVCRIGQGAASR